MGKVTCDMTMSVDVFVAGPNQSLENAFGEGAEALHQWMFEEPDANAAELEAMTAAAVKHTPLVIHMTYGVRSPVRSS